MRKLIVGTFITLDGVMQAPGGPNEDREGDFRHGGWLVPYLDEQFVESMTEWTKKPLPSYSGARPMRSSRLPGPIPATRRSLSTSGRSTLRRGRWLRWTGTIPSCSGATWLRR
jgi:hypothetical protein